MPAVAMIHDRDPKAVTMAALGDIDGFEVWKNQVLVAIYEKPAQTRGGILLPDSVRDEDKFQGKVGLVVALGKDAFVDSGEWRFSVKPEVGDWVWFRASESLALTLNKKACRVVDDVNIRGRITDPDMVW